MFFFILLFFNCCSKCQGENKDSLVRRIPKAILNPRKRKVIKEVEIRTRNYEFDALGGSNAHGHAAAISSS